MRGNSLGGVDLSSGEVRAYAVWNTPANGEADHPLEEERQWDRTRETVQRGTLRLENPRRRDREGEDGHADDRQNTLTVEAARRTLTPGTVRSTASNISIASTTATASTSTTAHSLPPSPYRDDDVLLSLQLLAYLSKYPHVRQAFYKKRDSFHPASAAPVGPAASTNSSTTTLPAVNVISGASRTGKEKESSKSVKESSGFFRAFASATIRGKDKERASEKFASPSSPTATVSPVSAPRQTNVFSLVERFTYRPSSSELAEYNINGTPMNAPPRLPPEIQYWAGVIMRNACRKDDSRGGIRQCANSECLCSVQIIV